MTRRKRLFYWILGTGCVLTMLLAIGVLNSNRLINIEAVKQTILNRASSLIGGTVEIQTLGLSFFPRPHLSIHNLRITVPGRASGSVQSVSLYPDLLAALSGRMRIAALTVQHPQFDIQIPASKPPVGEKNGPSPPEQAAGLVTAFIRQLYATAPDVRLHIQDGRIRLFSGTALRFSFEDIQTYLAPKIDTFDWQCRSRMWDQMHIEIGPGNAGFRFQARLELTGFKTAALTDYYFPNADWTLSGSSPHLTAAVFWNRADDIQATFHVGSPRIVFTRGAPRVFSAPSFSGTYQRRRGKQSLTVEPFHLNSPPLNLSARMVLERHPALGNMPVRIHLQAKSVDIASVRSAIRPLAGPDTVLGKIFKIVHAGRLSRIDLGLDAFSLEKLNNWHHLSFNTRIENGLVQIPDLGLQIKDVAGHVSMAQGMLVGEGVQGRVGKTTLHGADLSMSFGHHAPFHLKTGIHADLGQLRPRLGALFHSKQVGAVCRFLSGTQGTASATLVLGNDIDALTPQITVSEIHLITQIGAAPDPIQLTGGSIHADKAHLDAKGLALKLKGSTLSGVSARIHFSPEPSMDIRASGGDLKSNDILPWIRAFPRFARLSTGHLSSGEAHVSALTLSGPVEQPEKWVYDLSGTLDTLTASFPALPEPMKITGGRFHATNAALAFSDAAASVMDAKLRMSGTFTRAPDSLETRLQGIAGPRTATWLSRIAGLPKNITLRGPAAIDAQLGWTAPGTLSVSGKWALQHGTILDADLRIATDGVTIHHLTLGPSPLATLKGHLGKKNRDIVFSGRLDSSALNALLIAPVWLTGEIQGKFKARIPENNLLETQASGTLAGNGLVISINHVGRVEFGDFSAAFSGHTLRVEHAQLNYHKMPFGLAGQLISSSRGLILNARLATDTLDWPYVSRLLGPLEKYAGQPKGKARLPIIGYIVVNANRLNDPPLKFSPFRAEISTDGSRTNISVTEARLCQIDTLANISIQPSGTQITIRPSASGIDLGQTLHCLPKLIPKMDGFLDLSGTLIGNGPGKAFLHSMHGTLTAKATNGRLYEAKILSKVFSVLNLTEILVGKLPDLFTAGIPYTRINAKARFNGTTMTIEELSFNGPTTNITAQGTIDLEKKTINLTLLVAPLKTVDRIIKNVPLVRDILGGSLISIPVKITGPLSDPSVIPLSPTAVGDSLLNLMRRTLGLPFKLIQPMIP